jgi:RecA-family ATPase
VTRLSDHDGNIVQHPTIQGRPRLRPVCASEFIERAAPTRRWIVPEFVPAETVTLLSGDGATGKSLLALQLAVAAALRRQWLGKSISGGRVLYISCEDDLDELHRRVSAIVRAEGISLSGLGRLDDLEVVSLAGEDALFAYPSGNTLNQTALFRETETLISNTSPTLVVIDTLADVFGGEENHRAQARQFIGLLRSWCTNYGATILVLAHPSLTGMASGSGTSGSTAWSNSVRSRLYLDRTKKGSEDLRILTTKKANYTRSGNTLTLEWHRGAFRPAAEAPTAAKAQKTGGDPEASKRLFLDLLCAFTKEGRRVSASPSANYAPNVFAKDSRSAGANKADLVAAMEALFAEGRLRIEEKGPKSRPERRLVEVGREPE